MESAGRNVDQVASMVGKDAPSLDPSVARGGGPGHRVATQPETMTGVDDERWGIEVPGCRRPSDRSRYRGGSGSLAFAPDGRRPMTVPEPPADHHQRGHHHHARQQDEGEVHVRTWLFRADRKGCGTRPVSEDVARPIITCTSGSPVHASMAQRTAGPWSLAPAHKCRSAEVQKCRQVSEVTCRCQTMEPHSTSETAETPEHITVLLRSKYRCERCYKNCQVPCRFTGVEFRRLVRAVWSICDGDVRGSGGSN